MIDPVTGWFKVAEVPAKSVDVISNVLEMTWLVRYPRPAEFIMDRGSGFKGEVETTLRDEYGIHIMRITTRNPQANVMVERAHQTIKNMITSRQITKRSDLPDGSWVGILSAVGFGMRATVHTTTRAAPMQMVFNRDAIHNVRFEADWRVIRQNNEGRTHVVPHTPTK